MSEHTARSYSMIISGGMAWMALTAVVLWAMMAVIAVMPWTPQAANALRSAWIPAPPPESEPAIDRTAGTGRSLIAVHGSHARRSCRGQIAAPDGPAHVAEHLELGQPGHRLPHADAGRRQRVQGLV